MTDAAYHYPPELFNLLVEAIPKLCPRKRDLVTFFRGAGVPTSLLSDIGAKLLKDSASLNKYEIARVILTRLNERGDATLRERREVLRRVCDFEDFSTCWPGDQLQAKGLVASIREVVGRKDSFTRMEQEKESERKQRLAERDKENRLRAERQSARESVRTRLAGLFAEMNPQRRGKALEAVLNDFFKLGGIAVAEAFERKSETGEGVLEQIDGVVALDGKLFLVEMKWWREPLGPGEIGRHLVGVFTRGDVGGLCISASGFTPAAID